MTGPYPAGHWTRSLAARPYRELQPGRPYAVIQPFTDYDGVIHPVGEIWTYLANNFAPHDDGLSLFVSLDGVQEWHIRMQLSAEEQGPIINALHTYIQAVAPD